MRAVLKLAPLWLGAAILWTGFLWYYHEDAIESERQSLYQQVLAAARMSFEKDIAYRLWNSRLGGVYAEVSEFLRPNPYLDDPRRDETTLSGRHLTMVNPAYMTRMVHEIMAQGAGVRGRITSLRPIRPANAPAPWEAVALESFERGETEYHVLAEEDGRFELRFMRPLRVDKACLKCHAKQGYKEGEIRGGISVVVPMAPYDEALERFRSEEGRRDFGAWFGGMAFLGLAFFSLGRNERLRGDAAEKVRQSEERLALAVEAVNEGIWDWRQGKDGVYLSPRCYAMLGYRPDEFPFSREVWQRLAHPDDRENAERALREALAGGDAFTAEFRVLAKDGAWRWMLSRGRAGARDQAGGALRVTGAISDVTDRRMAEQRLLASESRFRAVVENSPLLGVALDPRGRIVYANDRFLELAGAQREETLGRDWFESFIPEDRRLAERRAFETIMASGAVSEYAIHENETQGTDGARRMVAWCNILTRGDGGETTGVTSLGLDITARVQAERALLESKRSAEVANRAKSEFLANMSHEIRTPLNGIMGMLQILGETSLDPDQRECVDKAFLASNRLTRLLSDVLDLSRIESGHFALLKTSFKLEGLCSSVVELLSLAALDKNLSLTSHVAKDAPSILIGDEVRLRQILFNLLGNAIKFTEKGEVRLDVFAPPSADPSPRRVVFAVSDSGPGIPDNRLGEMFDPFVQLDGSFIREHQGAGLGLSIVRRLMRLMNGDLAVESRDGEGTTFWLSLPFGVPQAPPADC